MKNAKPVLLAVVFLAALVAFLHSMEPRGSVPASAKEAVAGTEADGETKRPASPGMTATSESKAETRSSALGGSELRIVVLSRNAEGRRTPISDAAVSLEWEHPVSKALSVEHARSDEEGAAEFRFTGKSIVSVTAPGHLGVKKHLPADHGKVVELELQRFGSLEIEVLSPVGRPRADARVVVGYAERLGSITSLLDENERPATDTVNLITDASGRCKIRPILPSLPLKIIVLDRLYGRTVRHLEPLTSGEARSERIQLPQGGSVRVCIQDHLGNPLPGALVTCYQYIAGNSEAVAKSVTDTHGIAELPGLKEGKHRIAVTGWNASGIDLYLIDKDFEITLDETRDLGTLMGEPPFVELTLTLPEEDEEDIGARLVDGSWFLVNHEIDGGRLSYYHSVFPMGRPFRVWTGRPGSWHVNLRVLSPGSRMLDGEIYSQSLTVDVPGVRTIEFERRKAVNPEEIAVVSVTVPGQAQPMDPSNLDQGFIALLRGQEVEYVWAGESSESESTTFFLWSRHEGEHRVVGCIGGKSFEAPVDLQLGEQVELGTLSSTTPAYCVFEARWPGGDEIETAEVEIHVGSMSGDGINKSLAISFDYPGDHPNIVLPLGLPYTIVFSSGRKSGWAHFSIQGAGHQVIDLGTLEEL